VTALVGAGLLDTRFNSTMSGYAFTITASGGDYTADAVPTSSNTGRFGYFLLAERCGEHTINYLPRRIALSRTSLLAQKAKTLSRIAPVARPPDSSYLHATKKRLQPEVLKSKCKKSASNVKKLPLLGSLELEI
jgi:hypothetical protein